MAGKAGAARYFLALGSQSSDGFLHNRYYDRENFFGKFSVDLPSSTVLTLSSGYSEPEIRFFDSSGWGVGTEGHDRNFWSNMTLDTRLTDIINFNASIFRYEQKYIRDSYLYPTKTTYSYEVNDNTNTGFSSQLTGRFDSNLVVLGGEFERSNNGFNDTNRNYDETWALYLNDTFTLGPVTVTPGLRYDHLSLTDDIVSHSLGITWQAVDHTLFRFLAAEGFRKPYMYYIENAESGLEPEKIASYQVGFETTVLPAFRLKGTFFEHRLKNVWAGEWIFSDDWKYNYYNADKSKRYGYELELTTIPWHYVSAQASFTYVYTDYYGEQDNDDSYSGKLTLLYDNPHLFTAELFGHYMWWNEDRAAADNPADYGTMIWDLSLTKPLQLCEHSSVDIFFTAHNLFDGRDYWIDVYDNAHRWIEGGLRFHF